MHEPDAVEQLDALASEGRWSDAHRVAEEAARHFSGSARLHAWLSRIGLEIGRPDVTIRASHRLAGLTDMSYWQLRRWVVAATRLDDASELRLALATLLRCEATPAASLPEYFELASRFHDTRSMDLVRERAGAIESVMIDVLEARASGNSKDATVLLNGALQSDSRRAALWVERGKLRLSEGDASGALEDFDTALACDSSLSHVRRLQEKAKLIEQSDEALAAELEKRLAAERPSAFTFLTRIEQLVIAQEVDAALAVIERGLIVHPANASLRRHRPLCLARLGRFSAAIAAAAENVEREAQSAESLLTEAEVHRLAGTPGRQLENLNKVLSLYGLAPLSSNAADSNLSPKFLRAAKKLEPSPSKQLVTVVMTAYGFDDRLESAVDSILAQTHEDLELIVVDDCSPDETFEYLVERARSDDRLRPLQMPENSGTYRAKNLGLLHSRGEYLAFMDSDDFSHPQRLEVQLAEFAKNPDLALVSHWLLRVESDSAILFKRARALRLAFISPMIPRSVVETVGYFDRVRVGADSEYIKRIEVLFGASNHRELKSPLMVVSSHAESLTGGGPFHISWRGINGVRMAYRANFTDWHHKVRLGDELGYMPYDPDERLFPAPELMLR